MEETIDETQYGYVTKSKEPVKEKEKKISAFQKIYFGFSVISVIVQIIITFYLLASSSADPKLERVIVVLGFVYLGVFLIMVLMNFHTRKLSKNSLAMYKGSMKFVKHAFKLIMLSVSILNIISASSLDLFALVTSVALLIFNIMTICLSLLVSFITGEIKRRLRKKNREKKRLLSLNLRKPKKYGEDEL